jgi:hypothetical protein
MWKYGVVTTGAVLGALVAQTTGGDPVAATFVAAATGLLTAGGGILAWWKLVGSGQRELAQSADEVIGRLQSQLALEVDTNARLRARIAGLETPPAK